MAIITLSTDIGTNDFITGAFKGQLLSENAQLQLVDITHQLSSSNFAEAAYICNNAFVYYPEGTIHIVLTNMFEYPHRHFLLAKYGEQFILCPDNGMLTMICRQQPKDVFRISLPESTPLSTMAFLAAYARSAAQLAKGKYPIQVGEKFEKYIERYPMRPTFGDDWIDGQIIFIDKFENVVVNINQEEFEACRKDRSFAITFGRNYANNQIDRIMENYATAGNDECLATFNSAGMLELSIRNGNMAGLFGLQGFKEENQAVQHILNSSGSANKRNWFYQTIRIFFT
ncbi:MAG TPA: SAM-dependent chlorinase/fluorinase [Arachidicoccus sp.]|nr:SAM-dependent chlorinase/fluorinase [Arachidicoccus sp.]